MSEKSIHDQSYDNSYHSDAESEGNAVGNQLSNYPVKNTHEHSIAGDHHDFIINMGTTHDPFGNARPAQLPVKPLTPLEQLTNVAEALLQDPDCRIKNPDDDIVSTDLLTREFLKAVQKMSLTDKMKTFKQFQEQNRLNDHDEVFMPSACSTPSAEQQTDQTLGNITTTTKFIPSHVPPSIFSAFNNEAPPAGNNYITKNLPPPIIPLVSNVRPTLFSKINHNTIPPINFPGASNTKAIPRFPLHGTYTKSPFRAPDKNTTASNNPLQNTDLFPYSNYQNVNTKPITNIRQTSLRTQPNTVPVNYDFFPNAMQDTNLQPQAGYLSRQQDISNYSYLLNNHANHRSSINIPKEETDYNSISYQNLPNALFVNFNQQHNPSGIQSGDRPLQTTAQNLPLSNIQPNSNCNHPSYVSYNNMPTLSDPMFQSRSATNNFIPNNNYHRPTNSVLPTIGTPALPYTVNQYLAPQKGHDIFPNFDGDSIEELRVWIENFNQHGLAYYGQNQYRWIKEMTDRLGPILTPMIKNLPVSALNYNQFVERVYQALDNTTVRKRCNHVTKFSEATMMRSETILGFANRLHLLFGNAYQLPGFNPETDSSLRNSFLNKIPPEISIILKDKIKEVESFNGTELGWSSIIRMLTPILDKLGDEAVSNCTKKFLNTNCDKPKIVLSKTETDMVNVNVRNVDTSKPPPGYPTCNRCLSIFHDSDNCKFKNETCFNCQMPGHIARTCNQVLKVSLPNSTYGNSPLQDWEKEEIAAYNKRTKNTMFKNKKVKNVKFHQGSSSPNNDNLHFQNKTISKLALNKDKALFPDKYQSLRGETHFPLTETANEISDFINNKKFQTSDGNLVPFKNINSKMSIKSNSNKKKILPSFTNTSSSSKIIANSNSSHVHDHSLSNSINSHDIHHNPKTSINNDNSKFSLVPNASSILGFDEEVTIDDYPLNKNETNFIEVEELGINGLPIKSLVGREPPILSSDTRPAIFEIYVGINGIFHKSLCDSGANHSSIGLGIVRKYNLQFRKVNPNIDVTSSQGLIGNYPIIGFSMSKIILHDIEFPLHEFKVTESDNDNYAVILGADFLSSNHMIVDPHQMMLGRVYSKDTFWCLFVNTKTNECRRIISGLPVYINSEYVPKVTENVISPISFDQAQINFVKNTKCHCMLNENYNKEIDNLNNSIYIKNMVSLSQLPCPDYVTDIQNPIFLLGMGIDGDTYCHIKKGTMIGKASTILCPNHDRLRDNTISSINFNNIAPVEANDNANDNIINLKAFFDYRVPPDYELSSHDEEDLPSLDSWTKDSLNSQLNIIDGSPEAAVKVKELFWSYREVFSQTDHTPAAKLEKMRVELTEDTPIYIPQFKYSPQIDNEINECCRGMLEAGTIEPSTSKFNFPVLILTKKDLRKRIVLDVRKLNERAAPFHFPLMDINQVLSQLHGFEYYSSFDMVQGFFQVELTPESRQYFAFSTSIARFQFKRAVQGFKNTPMAFQYSLNSAFNTLLEPMALGPRQLVKKRVIIYLDDIFLMAEDEPTHLELLELVLECVKKYEIKLQIKKSDILAKEIKFLGNIIGERGVRKCPSYVEKLLALPQPKTRGDLMKFIGCVIWVSRFIPYCSEVARPLTLLQTSNRKLMKEPIEWTDDRVKAFEELKNLVAADVTLAFPDTSPDSAPLQIFSDASLVAAGGILCQLQNGERRTIGFYSGVFNAAQRNYPVLELELLAVKMNFRHFRPFIMGREFQLFVDHNALTYMSTIKPINARLIRTFEEISSYNFTTHYIPGKENIFADMLSRMEYFTLLEEGRLDHYNLNELPPQLTTHIYINGGGNSLVESLTCQNLIWDQIEGNGRQNVHPTTVELLAVRKELHSEIMKNQKRYNVNIGKNNSNLWKSFILDGMTVPTEFIQSYSNIKGVKVEVYIGHPVPITYLPFNREEEKDLKVCRLQCLGGVHYNLLKLIDSKDKPIVSSNCCLYSYDSNMNNYNITEETQIKSYYIDSFEENLQYLNPLPTKKFDNNVKLSCGHKLLNPSVCTIYFDYNSRKKYCTLLDSGSSHSIVSQSVADELIKEGNLHVTDYATISIEAAGGMMMKFNSKVCVGTFGIDDWSFRNGKFFVIPDNNCFNCFILGMDIMGANNFVIDFHNEQLRLGHESLIPLLHPEQFSPVSNRIIFKEVKFETCINDFPLINIKIQTRTLMDSPGINMEILEQDYKGMFDCWKSMSENKNSYKPHTDRLSLDIARIFSIKSSYSRIDENDPSLKENLKYFKIQWSMINQSIINKYTTYYYSSKSEEKAEMRNIINTIIKSLSSILHIPEKLINYITVHPVKKQLGSKSTLIVKTENAVDNAEIVSSAIEHTDALNKQLNEPECNNNLTNGGNLDEEEIFEDSEIDPSNLNSKGNDTPVPVIKEKTLLDHLHNLEIESHTRNYASEGVLRDMQNNNKVLKLLKACIENKKFKWPLELKSFWNRKPNLFIVRDVIVFYSQPNNRIIPLITRDFLYDVAIRCHINQNHIGGRKLTDVIKKLFYNDKLFDSCKSITASCGHCQLKKYSRQPMAIPVMKVSRENAFELGQIDLIEMGPSKTGKKYLMTIIDTCSKWGMAIMIPNKSSEVICSAFKNQVIPYSISPFKSLYSDCGTEFTSTAFRTLLRNNNIEHITGTPFMARGHGGIERFNKTIREFIRLECDNCPSNWTDYVGKAVETYNTTVHSAHGESPSKFLFEKAHISINNLPISRGETVFWSLGNPRFASFKIGQIVIKRKNPSSNVCYNKLTDLYTGPYRVIRRGERPVSYCIQSLANPSLVIPAHHAQLYVWRNPDRYLASHDTYKELLKRYEPQMTDIDDTVLETKIIPAENESSNPIDIDGTNNINNNEPIQSLSPKPDYLGRTNVRFDKELGALRYDKGGFLISEYPSDDEDDYYQITTVIQPLPLVTPHISQPSNITYPCHNYSLRPHKAVNYAKLHTGISPVINKELATVVPSSFHNTPIPSEHITPQPHSSFIIPTNLSVSSSEFHNLQTSPINCVSPTSQNHIPASNNSIHPMNVSDSFHSLNNDNNNPFVSPLLSDYHKEFSHRSEVQFFIPSAQNSPFIKNDDPMLTFSPLDLTNHESSLTFQTNKYHPSIFDEYSQNLPSLTSNFPKSISNPSESIPSPSIPCSKGNELVNITCEEIVSQNYNENFAFRSRISNPQLNPQTQTIPNSSNNDKTPIVTTNNQRMITRRQGKVEDLPWVLQSSKAPPKNK